MSEKLSEVRTAGPCGEEDLQTGSKAAVLRRKRINLDPRTKLILWIFANVSLYFFRETHFPALIMTLYAVLFLLAGQYRTLLKAAGGFAGMYVLVNYAMPHFPSLLSFLLAMIFMIYIIYPAVVGAIYMVSTTSVGEVTDAFRRMHVPESACIMFAVVLRFFPAVREEISNIRSAMKLRRIRGLSRRLEYIYTPMLVSIAGTAGELGDSITARGIENPARKTSWHEAGFHVQDRAVLACCAGMLIVSCMELAGAI